MARYSHSQINRYKSCQLRYAYKYVMKYDEPFVMSLALVLGTSVHDTLERLHKQVAYKQTPTYEALQERYEEIWLETLATGADFDPQDISEHHHRGVHYLRRYRETYHPFTDTIPMAMEKNIHFTIGEDHAFSGKIDRLDVRDHTMTIVDYKTNKSRSPDTNDSIREQITLYAKGIQREYGSKLKTIMGKVIYLHLENEIEREVTQDAIDAIEHDYIEIITEIETKKAQRARASGLFADGTKLHDLFEPTTGHHCNRCPFKSICPEWSHAYGDDESIDGQELGEQSIRHLVDEYARIQSEYKQLESQKNMIKDLLTDYAQSNDHKRLFGESHSIGITSRTYRKIKHEDRIRELLTEQGLLDQTLSIDINKLIKLIDMSTLQDRENNEIMTSSVSRRVQGVKKL